MPVLLKMFLLSNRVPQVISCVALLSLGVVTGLSPIKNIRPSTGESSGPIEQNKKRAQLSPASIDINHASAQDFAHLPGVGPELARRIVAYRDKHGPFRRVEDLLVIRGIGPKKWRVLRNYLRVG